MSELNYIKVYCISGHWSTPILSNETIGRRCNVCGRLYELHKQKIIVPCTFDGTELKEDNDKTESEDNIAISNDIITEDLSETCEVISNEQNNILIEDTKPSFFDNRAEPKFTEEKKQFFEYISDNLNKSECQQEAYKYSENTSDYFDINEDYKKTSSNDYSDMSEMQVKLITGDKEIIIPENGGFLGRNEIGREYFGTDLMISRRHCFVKFTHFGQVLVRDENSLNGTFVDDGNGRRRLMKGENAILKAGSYIFLADYIIFVK